MKEVSGKAELLWTVQLPDDHQYNEKLEGLCDDPAIEAVLKFIPQMGHVLLREKESEPIRVYTELHEEDFEIEEDSRDKAK
jgi:hypothetical protein